HPGLPGDRDGHRPVDQDRRQGPAARAARGNGRVTVATDAGTAARTPAQVAQDTVLVLDFGSQYSQLIARRVREAKVYCELVPGTIGADEVRRRAPRGLIFSGGPASVYAPGAPHPDPRVYELGIPILGICY